MGHAENIPPRVPADPGGGKGGSAEDFDALLAVIGSPTRASVLAALFGRDTRGRRLRDLERVAGVTHQAVLKELRRFQAAGLVRATLIEGRRHYEPETEDPVARALARFVHQTRGKVPAIRHVLEELRARSLAWLVSTPSTSSSMDQNAIPALVVLTGAPRRLVQAQLGPVAAPSAIHSMPIAEWVTRLNKGETFVRRARRGAKLWIVGNGEELVRWEQTYGASRAIVQAALDDWREQLSDDWDDDWDPDAPDPEIAR